jgi:hypothetical protein
MSGSMSTTPSLEMFEAGVPSDSQGKPAHLYYFGDFDPSGVDIPRKVEAELRRLAPAAEIHFHRVAVTEAQIRELDLPTRPTKRTDSRARGFGKESVEVDAIPPRHLRSLVETSVRRHIDPHQLKVLQAAEESERSILQSLAARWRDAS